jgi:prepilin-type N-terminal cleavage/methylation domain-containing protein
MKAVCHKAGFTLIEVCLAVLVIGIGLLSVFSLFPSGLRSVEDDKADTRCGLFAETVLNGMRGNAAAITNWDDWCDGVGTLADLKVNILVSGASMTTGSVVAVDFPAGGEYLRYKLTLNTENSNRYWAVLEVEDGQYPSVLVYPSRFYAEFSYLGK